MGHALATEGGFCTGSARVTDHQFWVRLFCFFAPISCEITAIDVLAENPDLITKLKKNITLLWKGLSGVMGLSLASNPESPIVFLKLQKSTSSVKSDLQLLNEIADCLLKDHSILAVASKRSTLDKCRLPVGIRLFVSAAHSESDLLKASESLKTVAESVLKNHI
ncbi:putative serine C-palmitoyltransferase [Rosa chinensis]|uniref:Putative serine C-palmitoyltransferase n=1 Tax=Rosa chinensis TaxID=74649 RepID=A0A2P6PC34_ROSCH|nr:putative serine C-palmitoyltransferase [Rosa chinensis]